MAPAGEDSPLTVKLETQYINVKDKGNTKHRKQKRQNKKNKIGRQKNTEWNTKNAAYSQQSTLSYLYEIQSIGSKTVKNS